jgi:hypothetical protein
MSEYFGKVRGALSVYCDENDGMLTDARFILCRHGEDADRVVEAFWREYTGSQAFSVIPIFARGDAPPRPELCSKQSLREAPKTAKIDVNGIAAQGWKKACEAHNVPWNALKAAPGWKT